MKNSIKAVVEFDFKGEHYRPSTMLDLDELMQRDGTVSNLYPILAKFNDIDTYSYQYEMMQAEEITFCEPSGMVGDFVKGGKLDFSAFAEEWKKQRSLVLLQEIALRHLGVDDLEKEPALCLALLEAYRSGKAGFQ